MKILTGSRLCFQVTKIRITHKYTNKSRNRNVRRRYVVDCTSTNITQIEEECRRRFPEDSSSHTNALEAVWVIWLYISHKHTTQASSLGDLAVHITQTYKLKRAVWVTWLYILHKHTTQASSLGDLAVHITQTYKLKRAVWVSRLCITQTYKRSQNKCWLTLCCRLYIVWVRSRTRSHSSSPVRWST
jgi:hypothetical protein